MRALDKAMIENHGCAYLLSGFGHKSKPKIAVITGVCGELQ